MQANDKTTIRARDWVRATAEQRAEWLRAGAEIDPADAGRFSTMVELERTGVIIPDRVWRAMFPHPLRPLCEACGDDATQTVDIGGGSQYGCDRCVRPGHGVPIRIDAAY